MKNHQVSNTWQKALIAILTIVFAIVGPTSAFVEASEVGTTIEVDQEALAEGLDTEGVLRVGMEANYAPFNWSQTSDADGAVPISNSDGEYANGYDVQIAKRLADSLGLELEIVKLEWDGLPPALESGMIDVIIAGMSPTPERLQQMDFSNSYYSSDIVLVTMADSEYADAKSLEDFAGTTVTGQLNTFHYDLIPQITDVTQATALDSFPTMITALTAGSVDAYVSEKPGAMAAVAANPDLTYVEFAEGQGFNLGEVTSDIAVATRKDSPLTDIMNQALATIPTADRDQLMEDMVNLNERGESAGFWSEVAGIWDTYGSQFLTGAGNTMFIALSSTIMGFVIGLLIAIYRSLIVRRDQKPVAYFFYKLFDFVIAAYIEIFRGTPMMVQAMMIFYGSRLFFNFQMSTMFAALLIVSINTGAYLAEVIRGGITSVDKGQTEAARAIGMNHYQTMTTIVLPQAIRSILPALGNEFVINIKDTSVLNVIAVTELFFVTKSAAGSTYLTFQTFLITAIIYFVLTFTTTRVLNFIENRMAGKKTYHVYESSTNTVINGQREQ
ncbi:putative lysine transport system substrate-binding protein/putative lysine transport system permease protein [Aerococcus sp. 150760007-1]|uniref:ABC transporter permease subunit n=1 Tax=Aerococcus urinaeequi TaxID=51665 RepID=A0ABR5ZV59_9LACT|nr:MULTISPECIES: ABC transporter permease subunit [Aerococcus]MBA5745617.1 ABC transporter permease subunit [Aerococcus urinaeequi]MBA5828609.1 ABC transporter permease subunit [Aerococcus urinaeequi]MBA5859306.1 ABC transporter permease subunit [Aerococcus urinaeequi]